MNLEKRAFGARDSLHLKSAANDALHRDPVQGCWSWLLVALIVLDWFALHLFIAAPLLVSVRKDPAAFAVRLVIGKAPGEAGSVGHDPVACNNFVVFPVTGQLQIIFRGVVGALALLVSKAPPTGINVARNVGENALSVTVAVFPITLVLSLSIVAHAAKAVSFVLDPATVILVASGSISIATASVSNSVEVLTFVNIAVGVGSSGLA